ncbi:MAG: transglutaminase-like domain-containing protein [Erysipelotrichaceae bacterium]|nr:transglutaminase-like domain-containing protein [Erysipelotrichaceae bacterium]
MMKRCFILFVIFLMLCGCKGNTYTDDSEKSTYPDSPAVTRDEILLSDFSYDNLDGGIVYLNYSQKSKGYIGVALKEEMEKKVKIRIIKDDMTYTYDVNGTTMKAIPLQMGDGTYTVKIFEQIEGDQYALILTNDIGVYMDSEFSVYLYPNQIVDYDINSLVIDKSFEVTDGLTNDLDRIYSLFVYVLDLMTYDKQKAEYVKTVYVLPDLDEAITTGKGICFDYASLLAALCRIQHIPAKVIVGYTDIEYHAWCEIYLENEGWINPKVYFNAASWSLVDPTFADSGSDYTGRYDEVYHY